MSQATIAYAYPGATLRPVLPGAARPLTREQLDHGQAVLRNIRTLPRFLRDMFLSRYTRLLESKGLADANKWLVFQFDRRIWPRIRTVNIKNAMNFEASSRFHSEVDNYARLPEMADKELRRLADRVAGQLLQNYEDYCDEFVAENGGDNSGLFEDATQAEFYGHVAGMARAFNITPMHWRKYRKGKLDARSAIASLSRLVNSEWWERQFKAQRTRWREALLIALGNVNRGASSYASKQAIRDVRDRRQSNFDYLSSRELENVETGERFSLIDKVMASISNPEIRRMELMAMIAGVEQAAATRGDKGMFITITTPSKYHPTRAVGKNSPKVHFNHKWDGEAYTPKDGQRYLVKLWGKIRTAFKDNGLKVYGVRVVEPHHDATPHWHMMLFTSKEHRQQVIDIMRRYAMAEDGDERGAAKNRFDCKHMNKGGAAGYIAKYIAKNIDGYALDGERDHETGELLTETAAAVTAWASTWRIPQFQFIGLPSRGAWRECRKIRSVSLTNEFDESVEAVRAAADAGLFADYILAQGGPNVSRDDQTVRVARRVADERNAYDEEVQKIAGIFAPHIGADRVYETRTTQWRIVAKAVAVEPLTLKSASGAPRSPVNNCGLVGSGGAENAQDGGPVEAVAVMEHAPETQIDWDDMTVARSVMTRLRANAPQINRQQRGIDPYKRIKPAASARLTTAERDRVSKIYSELALHGIEPTRWEFEALARGAKVKFGDISMHYPAVSDWAGFQ
ncbi:replication endonuclease [Serratia entomophila]|uniref:replication endonuclease n=1 Tax=Serratia entomophila TaxID=42906 RepID=UPI00217734FA|nr:replication endonuclease [Serratia entomophila]CAI1075886.1 Bacteriophage replication gene A protein (GPA) [Serratia entomophila]CAI1740518.1 Bacteriophage replication gene A protein (GPA) [Serratia entomophila]CAI1760766.1 Bacteriophage replication gene A protein (GPA) [Serratia entomophila]CAI1811006.1 Bacteriophage replication gene A protein (GPA) [Serratia entomophila]CAI1855853.1 Bacteriophage replication gene A protein (GPA) [Serratia entomophila]